MTFTLIIIGIPLFLVTVYLTRRFWTAAAYKSKLEYIKVLQLAGFKESKPEENDRI